MQWIKSHLAIVVSASVAIISIGLLIFGMLSSTAAEAMQQDQAVIGGLETAKGANPNMIEEAKRQLRDMAARRMKALKELEQVGVHKPLVPEVFVPTQGDNSSQRYAFRDRFKESQQRLMTLLKAKPGPNPEDVKREVDAIEDMKAKALKEQFLGVDQQAGRKPGAGGPTSGPAPVTPTPPKSVRTPGQPATLEDLIKDDPNARVSINRAREIYCYAGVANLDPQPGITELAGRAPSLEDIWYAQMSLWIQEDVLGALARVNQRVADQLPEGDRWVGNLPVKRLIYIMVGNYLAQSVTPAGPSTPRGAPAPGMQAPPPGDPALVFTQRPGSATVDVMQFSIDLVVEARMLPTVISEISDSGFYTPLMVTYEQEPPNGQYVGYLYGQQPVIKVHLEFEACFLRSQYDKWMPESVKKEIQEGRSAARVRTPGGAPGGAPGGPPGGMPGRGGQRGRMMEEGT